MHLLAPSTSALPRIPGVFFQAPNSCRTSPAISAISATALTRTEFCSSIPIANRVFSSCKPIIWSTTAVNEACNCSSPHQARFWLDGVERNRMEHLHRASHPISKIDPERISLSRVLHHIQIALHQFQHARICERLAHSVHKSDPSGALLCALASSHRNQV